MPNTNRFDIDFFEFSFLVEACIPERPIARAMFWHKVIDTYYYVLTPAERISLFMWINRNTTFDPAIEDCAIFNARFDPNNQYKVEIYYNGEEKTVECFKYKDRYYTQRNVSVAKEFITKITKHEEV